MALASLYMLVSTIKLVEEASKSFRGNLTFYASQIEYETMQLIDHLVRFSEGSERVSADDIVLRFDILWSRVHIPETPDELNGEPLRQPVAQATLKKTREVLREIESVILSLDRDNAQAIELAEDRLRTIVPLAHGLALRAKDDSAATNTKYLRDQLRLAYFTVAFIMGMVLFGLLSVLILRADRRQIRILNSDLERRVQARTAALENVNSQLADEVNERKAEQAVLKESEERLAQAAQLAKLGYYIWDSVNDRCEFCSDQHAAMHGLTPEEYIAQAGKLDGEFSLTHPDDREMVREKFRELRAGQLIEIDYRILASKGVRRIREIARPVFDDAGRVVKEIGSTLDVTEQHEIELKLAEAQRMDSIGKLTGGVAHDFNNLMAVILGNLELLKEVPESDERAEMLEDAIKATLRGRDLTLNMLSFARRAPLDPSRLNLNSVVTELHGLLRRTLPENITLTIDLEDQPWDVMADRSLTESALLNLVINSRDAMPGGGNLKIRTKNMTLGRQELRKLGEEIEPANYVMLVVSDTGTGMDKDTQGKIFEPFYTTKPPNRNSGLGLSMVQGFIKQTGGAVQVISSLGTGTDFRLFFRSLETLKAAEPTPAPDTSKSKHRGLRVLLVEDDMTVRKTLTRQLERAGMNVVGAADSKAALDAFVRLGPFDLVVSDIVMPGTLQGPGLVRKLRKRQSGLPAIFLSGYPRDAMVHTNALEKEDTLLMKPVGRAHLIAAIDDVIGHRVTG